MSTARRLRKEMTAAETMLWRSLRNRGIAAKFRRQVPIGPFVADFACVAARLIVELDGRPHDDPEREGPHGNKCFVEQGCPRGKPASDRSTYCRGSPKLHDRFRDAWLAEQGWRVLRVSNDVVIGGGDIVIGRIKAALAPHIPSSDPR